MRSRSLHGLPALAVTVTCLVATACYAGAVTQDALLVGVLTGSLGCAGVVVLGLRRHGVGLALTTGVTVAFAWALLVNAFTGDTNGPAARSTMIAGMCTSIAVAAVASSRPSLFLAPVGGIVFGALALGGGGEVRVVALLVVVTAVATLAVLEHEHRRWLTGGRRTGTVVLIALLVGATALVGALVQSHRDSRPARVLDAGAVNATIRPQWSDPLPNAAPTHRHDTRVKSTSPSVVRKERVHRHHSSRLWWWLALVGLALLALLVVAVAALTIRLLVVRLRWRQVRRTLAGGPAGEAVPGAWVWARMRLLAFRMPMSASAAPDLGGAAAALGDLPEPVAAPLRKLAPHAAVCAFAAAPLAEREDVQQAWRLADECVAAAFGALTRWGRWRARFRPPLQRPRSGKPLGVIPEASRG
jgi:hypothetical protein